MGSNSEESRNKYGKGKQLSIVCEHPIHKSVKETFTYWILEHHDTVLRIVCICLTSYKVFLGIATMGNGSSEPIQTRGSVALKDKLTGLIIQLEDVDHIPPNVEWNLISVGMLIDKGWKVNMKEDVLLLTQEKGGHKGLLKCPRHPDGMYYLHAERLCQTKVPATKVNSVQSSPSEETDWKEPSVQLDDLGELIVNVTKPKIENMDINETHDKMGHIREALIRKI